MLFIFPCEGQGLYLSGKSFRPLINGDVLMSGLTSQVILRASVTSDFTLQVFSSGVENLYPCFGATELSVVQPLSERIRGIRIYSANTRPATEGHRLIKEVPPKVDLEHRAQLLRIAAVFLNHEFQELQHESRNHGRVDPRLLQQLENLQASDLLNTSVSELAARFACSRRHLNRLFHQYFKVSVGTLKMEIRLLKAVSLLKNPEAKIINVAEDCGFHHLGLFNTCFRKRFGITPTAMRKGLAFPGKRKSVFNIQKVFLSMGIDTSLAGNLTSPSKLPMKE
jgi:AraC-like DNA-binding protein